jgi:hypothetical protein
MQLFMLTVLFIFCHFALPLTVKEVEDQIDGKKPLSPDDDLGLRLQLAIEKNPPTYWERTIHLDGLLNPGIAYWMNMTFLAWREGMRLRFGYIEKPLLHFKDGDKISPITIDDLPLPLFNLGPYIQSQEDARLLVLHNNHLLITYVMYTDLYFGISSQCYAILEWDVELKTVHVRKQHILNLQGVPEGGISQKNWTPFEWKRGIYFVVRFNPLHVVTLTNEYALNNSRQIVRTVADAPEASHLPWAGSIYGNFLAGGSPMFWMDGMLLALYHTVSLVYRRRVYFMGLVALCPDFPFAVHAVSEAALLLPPFYLGPWMSHPALSYVLFPQALFSDQHRGSRESDSRRDHHTHGSSSGHTQSRRMMRGGGAGGGQEGGGGGEDVEVEEAARESEDRYVWVGFGFQDKDAVLARWDIRAVVANLTRIRECPQTLWSGPD